jgi:hypothetical protein
MAAAVGVGELADIDRREHARHAGQQDHGLAAFIGDDAVDRIDGVVRTAHAEGPGGVPVFVVHRALRRQGA